MQGSAPHFRYQLVSEDSITTLLDDLLINFFIIDGSSQKSLIKYVVPLQQSITALIYLLNRRIKVDICKEDLERLLKKIDNYKINIQYEAQSLLIQSSNVKFNKTLCKNNETIFTIIDQAMTTILAVHKKNHDDSENDRAVEFVIPNEEISSRIELANRESGSLSRIDVFWDKCKNIKKSDGFALASGAALILYYVVKAAIVAGISASTCGIAVGALVGAVVLWQLVKAPLKRFFSWCAFHMTGKNPGWGSGLSNEEKLKMKNVRLEAAVLRSKCNKVPTEDSALTGHARLESPAVKSRFQEEPLKKKCKVFPTPVMKCNRQFKFTPRLSKSRQNPMIFQRHKMKDQSKKVRARKDLNATVQGLSHGLLYIKSLESRISTAINTLSENTTSRSLSRNRYSVYGSCSPKKYRQPKCSHSGRPNQLNR
jgi:hypothetical protein